MKKTISILLTLFLSNIFINAQELPDVEWGQVIKEGKKITLKGIVGTDENNSYTLKIKYGFYGLSTKLIIGKLDSKLNQILSEEIDLKYEKKSMKYEHLTYRHGELLLFTSFKNNKIKKKYLFVQHIDKNTLLVKGDLKKVAEIDYSNKSKWNTGSYDFEDSRDKSKLLVYYHLPYDKGSKERFGFHVYDENNKQLWEKKVTLPELEERYSIDDFAIDDDGNVQVIGLIYNGEKRRRGLIGNYSYEILNFTDNGSKMKRYPIKLTDKFITDLKIAVNDEKDILCSGFYSEKSSYSIAGTFFMKVDHNSGKAKKQSFKKFTLDFITQNMTERQEKKAKKKASKGKKQELYQYDLDEMILTKNGGVILIGEQFYIREVTRTTTDANGNTTTTTTYYYYYNDIIVVNITPEGEIGWAQKIPKTQITTNDYGFYSSYYMTVSNNRLNFIFNDHILNITEPIEGRTRNFTGRKNGVVALVTIDKNGNQKRQALFKTKEAEVIIRPKVCKQVNNKETIIFGQKKKYNQFGKLKF